MNDLPYSWYGPEDLGSIFTPTKRAEQGQVNAHLRAVWLQCFTACLSQERNHGAAEEADRAVREYELRFVREEHRGQWKIRNQK